MAELVRLVNGKLYLKENWRKKLRLNKDDYVSIEVTDSAIVVKPEFKSTNSATRRLLEYLRLPTGSLAHLAIESEDKDIIGDFDGEDID